MKTKRFLATLAVAALATTTLAGCGSRPDTDEIKEAILASSSSEDFSEDYAECTAQVFSESDISDEGLELIVEDEDADPDDLSSEDREVFESEEFQNAFTDCVDEELQRQGIDEDETAPAPTAPPTSMEREESESYSGSDQDEDGSDAVDDLSEGGSELHLG